MIFSSFLSALGQMGDPRFRSVLFKGIGITVVLLIAFSIGFVWLMNGLSGLISLPDFLNASAWLGSVVSFSSIFLVFFLSIFLMIPVASAVTSLFLDQVAQAVEDKHFPNLDRAREVSIKESIRDSLNFLGLLIIANIFALILYVIFSFAAPFIFWGLNGFLLGREYFTMAAMRRVGRVQAKALRRQHIATIWIAGVLMAMPLSIPLLNLIIPILGAATFTHLFHRISASQT